MREFSTAVALLSLFLLPVRGQGQGEIAAQAKLEATLSQEEKIDREGLIKELLELSGTKKQIQQIPSLIHNQLAQRQTETDSKAYASVKKIMTESYQAEALYKAVAGRFKEKFDHQRLLAVLQFARSPLAREMAQLEPQATTAQGIQELQKFAAQLQHNPPAKQRLTLVQRLDEATGTTQLSIQITLATIQTLAKATDSILPPEKRSKEGQFEQRIKDARAQLEEPLRNQTLMTLLYNYRTLSDSELEQYIQFAESDPGKWFHRVLSEGFMDAMALAAERAGNQMVKTLSPVTGGSETNRHAAAEKQDPFRPFILETPKVKRRPRELSPLERYKISQLKLVAIIWDIEEPRAMVEDAAGLGYIIKLGTPIGSNEGKVKAIGPNEVVIQEQYTDFYGVAKTREVKMKLASE